MKRSRWWTEDELAFVLDNPRMTAAEIGHHLGRGVYAVRAKRRQLERGDAPKYEGWTESEDEYILSNPHLTMRQLAAQLGRTPAATQMRRSIVGRRHGVNFQTSKRPGHIGERLLLAKTCPKCGLFLGARWYGRDTDRTWRSYCVRCRPQQVDRYKGQSTRPEQTAFYKRVQEFTRERATNNGQPWTEKDHEVLKDPDLPLITKALQLGRTYAATASQCSQNNYVSLVGLGPAERAQWLIYFANTTATKESAA